MARKSSEQQVEVEPQEVPGEKPKPKCLVGCGNDAVTRGLCSGCYGTYQSLIKKDKTTWEALEAAGLALPSKRKSTGPSAALAAFEEIGAPSGKKAEGK